METGSLGGFGVAYGRSLFRTFVAVLAFFGCVAATQAQTLKFAIGEWEPYTGQELPANGLATEIVSAASKAAGLVPVYEFTPWKRAEIKAVKNEVFATFPYLKSQERLDRFQFSDVLFSSGLRVLLFRDNEKTRGLDYREISDLKGLNVLIIAGSGAIKKMLEDVNANVVESQQMESGLKMLEYKRVDAIVDDQAVLFQSLASFASDKRAHFYFAERPFGDKTDYRLMSALSYPEGKSLLRQFNEGLVRIKASGELAEILKKYGL